MKKIVGVIIIALSFITVFTGCNESKNDKNLIKDVPTMHLNYTIEDKKAVVSVVHGTSSWKCKDGSVETDSLHPLDSVGYIPEIEKTDSLNDISISFSSIPTSYTVRRWEDTCIGYQDAYEKDYKVLEITDDTIILPEDNLGYIYEIHATWPQGNAYYAFYIKNVESNTEDTSDVLENTSDFQVFSIASQDGNTIVNVETILDYNDEKSIGIISVVQKGVVVNSIDDTAGYYEDMYLDEKSSLVVIKYFGRKWSNFLLIDIVSGDFVFYEPFSLSEVMTVFDENKNKMEYEVNDNDLMGFTCEKIIDSDLIVVGYYFHDTEGKLQSGTFNYSISKKEFNDLHQNDPISEG